MKGCVTKARANWDPSFVLPSCFHGSSLVFHSLCLLFAPTMLRFLSLKKFWMKPNSPNLLCSQRGPTSLARLATCSLIISNLNLWIHIFSYLECLHHNDFTDYRHFLDTQIHFISFLFWYMDIPRYMFSSSLKLKKTTKYS